MDNLEWLVLFLFFIFFIYDLAKLRKSPDDLFFKAEGVIALTNTTASSQPEAFFLSQIRGNGYYFMDVGYNSGHFPV